MTSQEKKAYLSRYRKADQEIGRLCEELSRWRSRALKITPVLSQEPAGGREDGNQVETAVEKIIALEEQISAQIDALLEIKQEVVEAIKSVPDETLQLLLSRRYVLGETFEQIAVAMNFSWRQIIRLHGKALLGVREDVIECHIKSMI